MMAFPLAGLSYVLYIIFMDAWVAEVWEQEGKVVFETLIFQEDL